MRPEDVREHLKKQPFEPFRICLSDGQMYDVRHPDMCIVARSTVYIGIEDAKTPDIAERVAHMSLIHITRIEPVNGQRAKRARR